jgi:hypothetical protein
MDEPPNVAQTTLFLVYYLAHELLLFLASLQTLLVKHGVVWVVWTEILALLEPSVNIMSSLTLNQISRLSATGHVSHIPYFSVDSKWKLAGAEF